MNKRALLSLTTSFLITLSSLFAEAPRILIAGDSIVQTYSGNQAKHQQGWGQRLPDFLQENVQVVNFALSGKSTRTFKGTWKKLSEQIEDGTFVLIQFGHNDSHKHSRQEAADADTDYKENLTTYVRDVKSKGGIPILITPPYRRHFDEKGQLLPYIESKTVGPSNLAPYAKAMRDVAKTEKVALVDLFALSGKLVQSLGNDGARILYVTTDTAHSSPLGARVHAKMILDDLVRQKHSLTRLVGLAKLDAMILPSPKK